MNAVISSRTPEGEPFRCHYCGASDCIEPSLATGDAPCPCCGNLLWFSARRPARHKAKLLGEQVRTLLRSERRRPMFGAVATIARQVRHVFEARRRREPRPAEPATSGVYDHWLDG